MLTHKQQAIILTSIIGTILKEYDDGEASNAVNALKFRCYKFMAEQSGTKQFAFVGVRVVDAKKNAEFIKTVMIGDTIWQKAIDRYAKQKVVIEATALIKAVYEFNPSLLKKHVGITEKKIEALMNGATDGDEKLKLNGTLIGGYLTELLYEAMGEKVNGRLRALKSKVADDIKVKQ